MEKDISCKWKVKKGWVAVLITDKINFKIKAIVRVREGHYIIIKGTINQEDITPVNIYVPNIRANIEGHKERDNNSYSRGL